MSAFEDRMKQIADAMSPEAKQMVRQVVSSEYRFRFASRSELPENFAAWALKAAKEADDK